MSVPVREGNALTRLVARRWLTIVLILLAVAFIAQNRGLVSVDLFWISLTSPLWLVLLLLFLAGLIAGAATFKRRR